MTNEELLPKLTTARGEAHALTDLINDTYLQMGAVSQAIAALDNPGLDNLATMFMGDIQKTKTNTGCITEMLDALISRVEKDNGQAT